MPSVIDHSRLQDIKQKLKEMPKVEHAKTYRGPQALIALTREIRAMSRKGYGPKTIAEILKQEGLSASTAKVKKILAGTQEAAESQEDESQNDSTPGDPPDDSSESEPKPVTRRRPGRNHSSGKEVQL